MRPPLEEPQRHNPRSEKPQQPPPDQFTQPDTKGKKPELPLRGKPTQGTSEDKQPVRPPREQPARADLPSEKLQQPPPDKSMQPETKGKKPQKAPGKQTGQGDSQSEQPTRKPVLGNPRFYIARIPAEPDAAIQRAKVYIIPDTAFRHPQTFLFKNLPNVDRYWGRLNDAASTAQRVVRLERDGKPVPYFLLACRGEYPKPTSPRNDNAIFKDMHEPIFNDAFVFKLGNPELYGEGYARYVDIEEDIGSADWLPDAIRVAATKVDDAMADVANPGTPDMDNYADQVTMVQDLMKMLRWMRAIRKADRKYGNALPADGVSGVADRKKMVYELAKMVKNVHYWIDKGYLRMEDDPSLAVLRKIEDLERKVQDSFAILGLKATDVNLDGALSVFKNPELCGLETKENFERRLDSLRATLDAFDKLKAISSVEYGQERLSIFLDNVFPGVKDELVPVMAKLENIKKFMDEMKTNVADWEINPAICADPTSGSSDSTIFDHLKQRIQTLHQEIEMLESSGQSDLKRALFEAADAYRPIEDRARKHGAARKLILET